MKKLISLIMASVLLVVSANCGGRCGSCASEGTDQYHHEHMEKSCRKCGEMPCACKARPACRMCGEGCKVRSCHKCNEGTCKRHCSRCHMPMRSCRCNK